MLSIYMANEWTAHNTAQILIEIFPGLGRLIAVRLRENDSEADEATMMQMRVLGFLQHEQITTSELAKRRKVSLQSASVLVDSLVKKGWVVREPDPNDRRQWLLQVTPAGKAQAQASLEQLTHILTDVLSELSPQELEAAQIFLPALQRVVISHMTPEETPEK
jgi:DNA-binding MarR family transcriptional regulator